MSDVTNSPDPEKTLVKVGCEVWIRYYHDPYTIERDWKVVEVDVYTGGSNRRDVRIAKESDPTFTHIISAVSRDFFSKHDFRHWIFVEVPADQLEDPETFVRYPALRLVSGSNNSAKLLCTNCMAEVYVKEQEISASELSLRLNDSIINDTGHKFYLQQGKPEIVDGQCDMVCACELNEHETSPPYDLEFTNYW